LYFKIRHSYSHNHFSPGPRLQYLQLGYNITSGFDIWTSATGKGSIWIEWCASAKEFQEEKINWKNGKLNRADGDCTTIILSSFNANFTTLSQNNCMEKRRFICEVSFLFIISLYRGALLLLAKLLLAILFALAVMLKIFLIKICAIFLIGN
jgi:hypothetical protein